MKMNVALTADELMNVVDAAMDEAIDRGFDDEDEELVEDMLAIVDAALSAMGISIVEEEEEEDFFDDDDDDDEEDDEPSIEDLIYESNGERVISKDTADFILNTMLALVVNDDRVPDDEKWNTGTKIFVKFCEDYGIEGVDIGE